MRGGSATRHLFFRRVMNLGALVLKRLAEWDEKKHPRAGDGKFGDGLGGSKPTAKPKSEDTAPKSKPKGKPRAPESASTEQPSKAQVSTQEFKSLQEYGNVAYGRINGHLLGENLYLSPERIAETEETVKHIDQVMSKAKMARDVVVYRGMEGVPQIASKGESLVGQTMSVPNYWSTTMNAAIAKGYSGGEHSVRFEIALKKGHRALDMSTFSGRPEESEILLPRNTKYRVTGHRVESGMPVYTMEIDDAE